MCTSDNGSAWQTAPPFNGSTVILSGVPYWDGLW